MLCEHVVTWLQMTELNFFKYKDPRCSKMLCYIDWQVLTAASEEHTSSIFRVQPQISHISVCHGYICYTKESIALVFNLLLYDTASKITHQYIRDNETPFKYIYMSQGKVQELQLFQQYYLVHVIVERLHVPALQFANTHACLILVFQIILHILYKFSWKLCPVRKVWTNTFTEIC
jgi:hypothetical protein